MEEKIILLNQLLKSYEDKIDLVMNLFAAKFGSKNPTKQWRMGIVDRVGILDGEYKVEYSFHGAGCTAELENGEVISFDFLEDNSPTYDLFKFQLFLESTSEVDYSSLNIGYIFDDLMLVSEREGMKIVLK